jgi:hypothetical protein
MDALQPREFSKFLLLASGDEKISLSSPQHTISIWLPSYDMLFDLMCIRGAHILVWGSHPGARI